MPIRSVLPNRASRAGGFAHGFSVCDCFVVRKRLCVAFVPGNALRNALVPVVVTGRALWNHMACVETRQFKRAAVAP